MIVPELRDDCSEDEIVQAFRTHQVVLIKLKREREMIGEEAAKRYAAFCQKYVTLVDRVTLQENDGDKTKQCWYRSLVLSADDSPEAFSEMENQMPRGLPAKLKIQDKCMWIFWGHNPLRTPMRGRPEHVDYVEAMGTCHWQASGCKKWRLRRSPSGVWPLGSVAPHVDDVCEVLCEEGSFFLINTALYLHQTGTQFYLLY